MSNRLSKGEVLVGALKADTDITALDDVRGATVTSSSGGVSFKGLAALKVAAIAIVSTGGTSETDSAFDLPADGIVYDVFGKITTASSAGGTILVGLLSSSSGGDADGFMVDVSTSSTGDIRGRFSSSTSGAAGDFITGNTRGDLLSVHATGTTAADDPGMYAEKPHCCSSITAKSVTYTLNSTGATVAGYIYISYLEI